MSAAVAKGEYRQPSDHLLEGAVTAIAYSGYREGQHPDRGAGARNPTEAQILEDLTLLLKLTLISSDCTMRVKIR